MLGDRMMQNKSLKCMDGIIKMHIYYVEPLF